MISDTDLRRVVAKRLRDKYDERMRLSLYSFEPQDKFEQAYHYLSDLLDCLPDGESAFTLLADLIDPTCGFLEDPDNDEFAIRVVSGYACRNCGHEAIVERTGGGWAEPPNYCPNCGARWVSG